jgi:hypothetical protein
MCGMRRASCHEGGCDVADLGTVHIELDAGTEHVQVFFFEAGGGAMVAGGGTFGQQIEQCGILGSHDVFGLVIR